MLRRKPPAGWVMLAPEDVRALGEHIPSALVRRKGTSKRVAMSHASREFDTYAPPWAIELSITATHHRVFPMWRDLIDIALRIGEPGGSDVVALALAQYAAGGHLALRQFIDEERSRSKEAETDVARR